MYTGCGANKNNFLSEAQCKTTCGTRPSTRKAVDTDDLEENSESLEEKEEVPRELE